MTHIPGGMMEIVIGIIALENHLITETMFVAIVFGALSSSILLGPFLSFAVNRIKQIGVLDYFFKRGIHAQLKSNHKDQAIEELCQVAMFQGGILPALDEILKAVLSREQIMGTAIEEGIALPHARLPNLKRPMIVFGRSIAGLEWNSPDGKAVHFIFLILTPQGDEDTQVQILRAIAQVMRQERVREKIMLAEDSDKIWMIFQETFTSQQIIKR